MLRGVLAGAGCLALLDGCLGVAFPEGLLREAVVLALTGAFLVSLLVSGIFSKLFSQHLSSDSERFIAGIGLALPPLLSNWIFPFYLSLFTIPLFVWLAPRLSRYCPIRRISWPAALSPYLVGVVLFLTPSSFEDLSNAQSPIAFPENSESLAGPNVLLISVDTLRADRVLALMERLPHLRELQKRGAWAPFGLATSNQTLPSHVTMLTGLPILQHGVRDNGDKVPEKGIDFLAERFQKAGWNTAGVVMNGFLRGGAGFSKGFDVYEDTLARRPGIYGTARHVTQDYTWLGWVSPFWLSSIWFPTLLSPPVEDTQALSDGSKALVHAEAMLKDLNGREQPWFLFFHLLDPHFPYLPPAPWAGSFFQEDSIPESLREHGASSWDLMTQLKDDIRLVDIVEQTAEQAARHRDARTAANALLDLYDEEILYVDELMGELIKAASQNNRPMVILFTSDHGEHFGEHDLVLHSRGMFEELLQVPFIVVGHGMEAGQMSITPHLEDVAPTLLGLAGLSTEGLSGRDLSNTKEIKVPEERAHIERAGMKLTIRKGDWKLLIRVRIRGNEPLSLHNLKEDPGEMKNLVQVEIDKVKEMMQMAKTAISHSSGQSERNTSQEQKALLEHLGYVEERN